MSRHKSAVKVNAPHCGSAACNGGAGANRLCRLVNQRNRAVSILSAFGRHYVGGEERFEAP